MEFLNIPLCDCGKPHTATVEVITESGAIRRLPELVTRYGGTSVFVMDDVNTHQAAGKAVCEVLRQAGIAHSCYTFPNKTLKPDEHAVGAAAMHMEYACNLIITVGSGVLNDIGKILAAMTKVPYFIVGTATSMDGYASDSSSMERDGLKTTIPTRCADVIIGDLDVLRQAPTDLLISGLGDMLAKYISIGEWRISHIINDEYYCETVASVVREALRQCVENADGLLKRDEAAVKAVFEGLVLGGVAMKYAGASRPASGVDHYFSHVWDMRGLEFHTPVSTHGIQVAVGTLYTARLYDKMRTVIPDEAKAIAYAKQYDYAAHAEELRTFIGKGAEAMIAKETIEGKYDVRKHAQRIRRIIDRWDDIQAVIRNEIPTAAFIENVMDKVGLPKSSADFGVSTDLLPQVFAATKDIRDKYVLSHLCWDLGIIDELCGTPADFGEK